MFSRDLRPAKRRSAKISYTYAQKNATIKETFIEGLGDFVAILGINNSTNYASRFLILEKKYSTYISILR